MDLIEAVKGRRAIRKFKKDAVPETLIKEILEAGRWAPVADFFRGYRHIVVTSPEARTRVSKVVSQNTVHLRDLLESLDEEDRDKALDFYPDLGGAPVLLIITMPEGLGEWDSRMMVLAQGTELQNMLLAAHERGLGACPFSMAPWVEEELKKELQLTDQNILIGVALGWPDEVPGTGTHREVPTTFL